jgi:hypothetical protein
MDGVNYALLKQGAKSCSALISLSDATNRIGKVNEHTNESKSFVVLTALFAYFGVQVVFSNNFNAEAMEIVINNQGDEFIAESYIITLCALYESGHWIFTDSDIEFLSDKSTFAKMNYLANTHESSNGLILYAAKVVAADYYKTCIGWMSDAQIREFQTCLFAMSWVSPKYMEAYKYVQACKLARGVSHE